MNYLPNILLANTKELELYSITTHHDDFVKNLIKYFSNKEKEILNYFQLNNFRKVRINLFNNQENYKKFSNQFFPTSSYSSGNCCDGMINYVCTQKDLKERTKMGFLFASIVHELVHLIYNEQVCKTKCVWLEEGLAQYLSGQKSFLENDTEKYKNWKKTHILDKEIPPIIFLKSHGSKYRSIL